MPVSSDSETDPSKWVNPDTIYFTVPSVDDIDVLRNAWADFMTHMEKVTGKKVRFVIFQLRHFEFWLYRFCSYWVWCSGRWCWWGR